VSRRARHRGERIPGLFGFDNGAPTEQLDEVPDNPRARPCPWCHARPEDPCTVATRHGRRRLDHYHDSRKHPDQENTPCPPPSA
jgi:hypothetical protein